MGLNTEGNTNVGACGLGPTRRQISAVLQRFHLPGDRSIFRRYYSQQLKSFLQLRRRWFSVLSATSHSVALSCEVCCRAAVTHTSASQVDPSLALLSPRSQPDANRADDAAGDVDDDDDDRMSTASGMTTTSVMTAATAATSFSRAAAVRAPRLQPVPETAPAAPAAATVHATLAWLKENDPEEYRRFLASMLPQQGLTDLPLQPNSCRTTDDERLLRPSSRRRPDCDSRGLAAKRT